MRLFPVYTIVIIFMVYGCSPATKKYVGDSSLDLNNHARIHINSLTIGNMLVVDASPEVDHNSVIARGEYYTSYHAWTGESKKVSNVMYLGPGEEYKNSWGDSLTMGDYHFICGYTFKEDNIKHEIDGPFHYVCPKETGVYEVMALRYNGNRMYPGYTLLLTEDNVMPNGESIVTNEFTKVSRIKYTFEPVLIIGQLGPGENLIWSRPAGTLKLYGVHCVFSCGGEVNSVIVGELTTEVEAGKDYYIDMDGFYSEMSDKPF